MEVVMPFFCFSISKRSLFDDTKAISAPEKKAEKQRVIMIMIINVLIWFQSFSLTGKMPVTFVMVYLLKVWLDSKPIPLIILSACVILMASPE